jgi:transposase-like protein
LSIVWACGLSVAEYASAGKEIEIPEQACPGCGKVLAPWSWYRRWARDGGAHRIWVQRGCCRTCEKTHALLPEFVHERLLDAVEVIGTALELGVGGLGMRKVAARVGVPESTVRDWRRRYRERSPVLLQHLSEVALRLGAELGKVPPRVEQAVLVVLRVAWVRARERLPAMVPALWRFWNAVCGGRALARNTSPRLGGAG